MASGESLPEVQVAYETYGELSPTKDNAVLLFHALSGSQHAAGINTSVKGVDCWTEENHTGWWDDFIGPGKALDTRKYFIICANFLGGCYGTTGPSSINPETGKRYGREFPDVQMADIVNSQLGLVDYFGIEKLHAVIGPSIAGMMTLDLATRFPERVNHVVVIASAVETSILQRISNFEQIVAIENDLNFNGGDYYGSEHPRVGLALARMIAHKSYVSLAALERRAKNLIKDEREVVGRYQLNYPVESYMLHQGSSFIDRFDANSYILFCNAWQKFNLAKDAGAKDLPEILSKCKDQKFLVFSIDSDVCFYPDEQLQLVNLLKEQKIDCQYFIVHSDRGHDSFLLDPELFTPAIAYRLQEGLGG